MNAQKSFGEHGDRQGRHYYTTMKDIGRPASIVVATLAVAMRLLIWFFYTSSSAGTGMTPIEKRI